ncbi:hypothetical protein [Halorientalis halophila]|uniref:hypothetical protein n=1 Tax=Halorientalis halophila TaxID=3108499 RepID=UPI00300A326C
MASEPTDEPVTVSLPPELATWIDEQATSQGSDRETVLAQLLAAHRAAEELDDADPDSLADAIDVETAVQDALGDRLPEIAEAVAERLDVDAKVQDAIEATLQEALDDRLEDVAETAAERASGRVDDRLDERLGAVEDDFMAKITDVRERVVQVKRETDAKAPADHGHPDLADDVDEVAADLAELDDDVDSLRDRLDALAEDSEARLEDLEGSMADAEEKLRTVAHVVRDLRNDTRRNSKRAASVEGIKRAAAELDVDRAKCTVCGEGVEIALMTDPECPHCEATVTDVEPKDSFFGNPTLVKAQGIAAPEDDDA